MNFYNTAAMLKINKTVGTTEILDTVKKPIIVTPSDSDYCLHLNAASYTAALANNNVESATAQALTKYSSESTRREIHMYKTLKNYIRLDTLLEQGYKYFVAVVPNYIRTNSYEDYSLESSEIVFNLVNHRPLRLLCLTNDLKPDLTRTASALNSDPRFATKSFNSLDPIHVIKVIHDDSGIDSGSHADDRYKYDLVYLHLAIDIKYVVEKHDLIAVILSTIGFPGNFYFSDLDYSNGDVSTFLPAAVRNLQYYYM